MSRNDRRSLLKTLWMNKMGSTLNALRITDVSDATKKEIIGQRGTRIDDSDVTDEHIRGFAPTIEDEAAFAPRVFESEILLNRAEKNRLAREVDAARWFAARNKNNWLILV